MIQFTAAAWSDLLAQPTEAGRATVLAGKFPSGATIEFLDATAAVIRTVTTGPWTAGGASAVPGQFTDAALGAGTPVEAVVKAGATEIMRMSCGTAAGNFYRLLANIVADVPIRRGPFAITFLVPSNPVSAPSFQSAPVITGTPAVGNTLAIIPGVVTGNPTPTVTYQWLADGSSVIGTNTTLTLTLSHLGKSITVRATATNSEGTTVRASDPVGPVAGPLTFALPTAIEIPQDGSILLSNYVAGGTPPYSNYAVDTGTLPTGVNLNPTTSELSAAVDATITTVTGLKFSVKDSAAEVLPVSDDQFAVQDAYTSGPRSGHWDYAADLRWTATNGDWLDANQVSQGATAYDTQTATAIGANMTFDVAALVQRFLTLGENRGFYLRGVSGDWRVDFAGRLSANPPVLTVVTTDGTFTPACIATAYWTHNAVTGQAGTTTFIVQRNGRSAIVRFDLSGVTGTVISASMVLRVTYRNENTQIGIFEADPPGFLLGGNYGAKGFADSYVLDSGIHAHSSVIATLQDWNWTTHTAFFDLYSSDATSLANTEFGTGLDGTKYIRLKLAAGTQDIPTFYKYFVKAESNFAEPTLILQRDAGNTKGQWINPSPSLAVHDELYVRYRMYLENDFRSTVDAGKFPGFDGRMGRWEVGKWQNVGGNSANDSLGIKRPYSTGWAFEGHSVRGSYMRPFIADGNPNAELWPYGVYLYSLDSGYYDGQERFGNAVLKRGEWYSIEWRMKMNTVSGAADEYGNQTANADGVLECWCDGTKVYSKTDIRWRRHPLLSVAAFHMQMYHGGTAASNVDMHVRFANFIVATEYIGPVRKV